MAKVRGMMKLSLRVELPVLKDRGLIAGPTGLRVVDDSTLAL